MSHHSKDFGVPFFVGSICLFLTISLFSFNRFTSNLVGMLHELVSRILFRVTSLRIYAQVRISVMKLATQSKILGYKGLRTLHCTDQQNYAYKV